MMVEVLLPADRIQQRVGELAQEIAAAYHGQPVTIVGVLTGPVVFMADLIRHLDLPLRLAFLQASSYRGAVTRPGELSVQTELLPDLKDRHVLLLDDILDTGRTLSRVTAHLKEMGTA